MTGFKVDIDDYKMRVKLRTLASRVQSMAPILQAIGEGIVERIKRRFDTSTGPDGVPWKPNSAATLRMLASWLRRVKGNVKKDGSLNARGNRSLAGKKPLIGESGDLRRQIVAFAASTSLVVSSTPKYAAIQNYGGLAGRGHKVVIPARPFMPVKSDGTLYPDEKAEILAAINGYLSADL